MLESILNYLFFTSVILIYGAGIEKTVLSKIKFSEHILKSIKLLLSVCSCCALSYIFCYKLLFKFDLFELAPFVTVIIFCVFSVLIELIFRITAKFSASDFGLSFIIILIALTESFSLGECLFIACICTFSYFVFIPLFSMILRRTDLYKAKYDFEKTAYILLTVSVLILILLVVNVSWLNGEVFNWSH